MYVRVNDEYVMIKEEVAVAYFKMSQHFSEATDGDADAK
jgi:hypothetical protein